MPTEAATSPKQKRKAAPQPSPAPLQRSTGNRRKLLLLVAVIAAAAIGAAFAAPLFRGRRTTDTVTARIVKEYPHDRTAWTQGLTIHDGNLYEGTGQLRQSTLRRVDLETGRTLQSVKLDPRLFGEGIAVVGDRIYQLSWQSRVCLVYDRASFRLLGQHTYQGEGWGLTYDGTHLIMSDGSSALRFMDPDTFKEVRRVWTKDRNRAVTRLNELEYIKGEVWANIWYQDRIARIDPTTGTVKGYVDMAHLWPRRERPNRETVLNGIAYDADTGRLFVTGKLWPKLFEVEVDLPAE